MTEYWNHPLYGRIRTKKPSWSNPGSKRGDTNENPKKKAANPITEEALKERLLKTNIPPIKGVKIARDGRYNYSTNTRKATITSDPSFILKSDVARFTSSVSNVTKFKQTAHRGNTIEWLEVEVSRISGYYYLRIDERPAKRLRHITLDKKRRLREFAFQFFPDSEGEQLLYLFQFPFFIDKFCYRYFIVWRLWMIKKSDVSTIAWADWVIRLIPTILKIRRKPEAHNDPVYRAFQVHI